MTSELRKKSHGVVYTPRWLVDLILDKVDFNGSFGTIIDPACGDGAFLAAAAERIIKNTTNKTALKKRLQTEIYGVDIDAAVIAKCENRLSAIAQKAGISTVKWNLRHGDCLDKKTAVSLRGRFDFVVGNPPYVRIQNLGESRRLALQNNWQLCSGGSTDIYIAFFELGVKMLKEKGKLGFITPNTWLKTKAAEELRRFFRREKIVKTLIDFEHWQLFENVTTYSLITILQKDIRHDSFSLIKGNNKGALRPLGNTAMSEMRDDNWILCSPQALKKLHALKKNRSPLSAIANIHVGITTLADKCYIFRSPHFDGEVARLQHPQTGKTIFLERKLLRPIIKASIIKNSEEEQHRYILFPYQKINEKNRLIEEEEIAEKYPLAYAYFRSIKNTLDKRDKGKKNPVGWYAFGRSQGLDTSFGGKILTSPMNLRPCFVVWEKPEYTFYSGYCIKFGGDLSRLARCLNSDDMAFYINTVSRDYQHNYKSFAKSFLLDFPVPALETQNKHISQSLFS